MRSRANHLTSSLQMKKLEPFICMQGAKQENVKLSIAICRLEPRFPDGF